MTITITLPPDTEQKLRERAAQNGQDIEAYARLVLERAVHQERTLDEILAPFRQQVAECGMTDAELEGFFEGVRDEVWRDQQGTKP